MRHSAMSLPSAWYLQRGKRQAEGILPNQVGEQLVYFDSLRMTPSGAPLVSVYSSWCMPHCSIYSFLKNYLLSACYVQGICLPQERQWWIWFPCPGWGLNLMGETGPFYANWFMLLQRKAQEKHPGSPGLATVKEGFLGALTALKDNRWRIKEECAK